MAIKLENVFYTNYEGRIQIDEDILLVAAWNEYASTMDEETICLNDKEFFENFFANKYDTAWAVSLSEKWSREDRFVYFNFNGRLSSFTHWNDENSPIDVDKIDINNLININKINKKRYVNNIPRAIHDALKEV